MNLIKPLTTSEVFEIWREIEENLEHWKVFWKAKDHSSWSDWRKATHKPILEADLIWNLYEVEDPLNTIPNWRGGKFHAWSKWFYVNFEDKPPRLSDLLSHPGVNNHWYIREISKNFPSPTTLSAIRLPNGEISIVEGMHRACALTMIASEKRSLNSSVSVALADWPDTELPKLGTNWNK